MFGQIYLYMIDNERGELAAPSDLQKQSDRSVISNRIPPLENSLVEWMWSVRCMADPCEGTGCV